MQGTFDPYERYLRLAEWLLDWLRAGGVDDPEDVVWSVEALPKAQEETLRRVQDRRPVGEQELAELIEAFMAMETNVEQMIRGRVPATSAEDLVHEVLARALDGQHRFDPQKGKYAQWLWGIAKVVVREFWSRRGKRALGDGPSDDLPSPPSAPDEARQRLRELGPVVQEFFDVVDAMPAEQRVIYMAVDIEGCPPSRFADALQWKRDSASSRLRLARERVLEARTQWRKRGLL